MGEGRGVERMRGNTTIKMSAEHTNSSWPYIYTKFNKKRPSAQISQFYAKIGDDVYVNNGD